jgi:hypothetical protein
MFNSLICEYKLPIEELEQKVENLPDWSELEFQTKSFASADSIFSDESDFFDYKYIISEDGLLYKQREDQSIEKVDFTGEVAFYGQHLDKNSDFWMELKAIFWKGDLKEMELLKWEASDNEPRLNAQKKLQNFIERAKNRREKWWWKLIYKPYLFVVTWTLNIFRYALSLLIRLSLIVERWITIN